MVGAGIQLIEKIIIHYFQGMGGVVKHRNGCPWLGLDVVSYGSRCIFYAFERK